MTQISKHLLLIAAVGMFAACQGVDSPTRPSTSSDARLSTQDRADAGATFTVEDLGAYSTFPSTDAASINSNGDVAGTISDPNHGVYHPALWIGTTVLDLGIPEGLYPAAVATDVNDIRTVVARDLGAPASSFMWKNGAFTIIPKPKPNQMLIALSVK